MTTDTNRKPAPSARAHTALALLLLTGTALAAVDIADSPLTVAEPQPPNIFFILDDSGSINGRFPDPPNAAALLGGTTNVIRSDTGKLRTSGDPTGLQPMPVT